MLPPILLANTDWYGTLAATRVLGAQGVPVYLAGDRLLASARWSRHAARTFPCPPLADPDRFLDWLSALGEREPGTVLYPTSDEAAFLYALRMSELSQTFRMYQPGLDTILGVLDKKRLYQSATAAGIDIPETFFPETEADVERIARDARMPVLVKPRTQVLSRTHGKGIIVRERSGLLPAYRSLRRSGYGKTLLDRMPDASLPMIQAYYDGGAQEIYVLAAFRDRARSLIAARSGLKIFQKPRSLGIGLCFVDAPLDMALLDCVRRLIDGIGYFGLLQLEFLRAGGRHLLIDFNPRFYNQLAFDVARGLPLPQMVYSAACDDADEVVRLGGRAQVENGHHDLVFCNDFALRFMVTAQRLVGRMSAAEARHWGRWQRDHRSRSIDPANSHDDQLPWFVDTASQLLGVVRHPRAFLRKVALDMTAT